MPKIIKKVKPQLPVVEPTILLPEESPTFGEKLANLFGLVLDPSMEHYMSYLSAKISRYDRDLLLKLIDQMQRS